ncbi:MAG TPA: hypothetical protein VD793_04605 [Gemmatimonadales bacterium]|nr:hypothetical protein [Gemmatimonadales bacterium]
MAFAGAGEAMGAAIARSGREGRRLTTDSLGHARIEIPPGRWWLRARQRVRDNPFQERLWNVPVTANRMVPVRVRLVPGNADVHWRH